MEINNPQDIAKLGQQIYDTQYRKSYENKYPGQFVAVNVETEKVFVAQFPEEALGKAREENPKGYFHLIKIGSPGAFKVSYVSDVSSNCFFDKQGFPCLKLLPRSP